MWDTLCTHCLGPSGFKRSPLHRGHHQLKITCISYSSKWPQLTPRWRRSFSSSLTVFRRWWVAAPLQAMWHQLAIEPLYSDKTTEFWDGHLSIFVELIYSLFAQHCKILSLLAAGSAGLGAGAPLQQWTLTSHRVEAAQGVEVPRWGSLLKELQIKLDITPKNRTRVRVRAGSASGITLQHSKARVQRPQRGMSKTRPQADMTETRAWQHRLEQHSKALGHKRAHSMDTKPRASPTQSTAQDKSSTGTQDKVTQWYNWLPSVSVYQHLHF